MLTAYQQARRLADVWVDVVSGGAAAVVEEITRTRPYGWVFFWNSKTFIETRDPMHSLFGNAPLIIDRVNFELRVTGTARPIEHYLQAYEAAMPPARLEMTPEYPPGLEPPTSQPANMEGCGDSPAGSTAARIAPRWQWLRLLGGKRGRPTSR